jgi:type IV pilus assembly protein PilC
VAAELKNFLWEARDKSGKVVRGEQRAAGEAVLASQLRRQGYAQIKIKKPSLLRSPKPIKDKELTIFTRQLATMVRSGVPLLTAFDIIAKGHTNPSMNRLLNDIQADLQTGLSVSQAFAKHPTRFDALYCNLLAAGEEAGILEGILERLATYKEKALALKSRIRKAMLYPAIILAVAVLVTTAIMLFVVPAFKDLFTSFGADLPAPTLVVMKISDWFVGYWWLLFGMLGGGLTLFARARAKSKGLRDRLDMGILRVPVFGEVMRKAAIARWTRTLSTMVAAGVPLVEALDSVAGASGNYVYERATRAIQIGVAGGTGLTPSMETTGVFPVMVTQMVSIGEESGQLDAMLGKAADFYEAEVDDAVDSLSTLMEPMIMCVLGVVIGGLVIAMYLPIFKIGSVIK